MKKYQIIYADPPWSYSDRNCNGACAAHYNVMTVKDICNLRVPEVTDKNAILFLWTTYPMLREAMEVIEAWGFKYKSIGFQWIKLNTKTPTPFFGLGRWTRGNTEPCLIATKGRPKRVSNAVSQLIVEPRERHSKKPDVTRDKITELVGELPRLEMFARQKTDGWDVWGNEVEKDVFLAEADYDDYVDKQGQHHCEDCHKIINRDGE